MKKKKAPSRKRKFPNSSKDSAKYAQSVNSYEKPNNTKPRHQASVGLIEFLLRQGF